MSASDASDQGRFQQPNLAINRVYTRKGDSGETQLVGGQKVSKGHIRLDAYGTVDELNAVIGMVQASLCDLADQSSKLVIDPLSVSLNRVQHELFNLGSILATLSTDIGPKQPRVTQRNIDVLEQEMDACNADLHPLRSFVLPGGCRVNAELHLARTICRRAERICVLLSQEEPIDPLCVKYLNRLSDAFFVWSRWISQKTNCSEILWDPNRE